MIFVLCITFLLVGHTSNSVKCCLQFFIPTIPAIMDKDEGVTLKRRLNTIENHMGATEAVP